SLPDALPIFDEFVRLSRIGLSEGGSGVVDDPDLVALSPTAPAEVQVIEVVGDREDAAADGHSRDPVVAGGPPRSAVAFDLLSLQIGERRARGFGQKGRTHHVHALLRRPFGGRGRTGTPPDSPVEAGRVRLDAQADPWAELCRIGGRQFVTADSGEEPIEL